MQVLTAVIGLGLLFVGRKLFWLIMGSAGLILGFGLAQRLFEVQTYWVSLVIALFTGILGVVIAMEMEHFALGAAGFIAGGLCATAILDIWQVGGGTVTWIAFGVGGILGTLLIAAVFDWAVILLSALWGAYLIAGLSTFGTSGTLFIMGSSFVFGVAGQVILLYGERPVLQRIRR